MSHAQLPRRGPLKGCHRLAQDELLRLKYVVHGFQQFLVKRAVLALEVQHGHGLGGLGGMQRRLACVFHVTMVPASESGASHGEDGGQNPPIDPGGNEFMRFPTLSAQNAERMGHGAKSNRRSFDSLRSLRMTAVY